MMIAGYRLSSCGQSTVELSAQMTREAGGPVPSTLTPTFLVVGGGVLLSRASLGYHVLI